MSNSLDAEPEQPSRIPTIPLQVMSSRMYPAEAKALLSTAQPRPAKGTAYNSDGYTHNGNSGVHIPNSIGSEPYPTQQHHMQQQRRQGNGILTSQLGTVAGSNGLAVSNGIGISIGNGGSSRVRSYQTLAAGAATEFSAELEGVLGTRSIAMQQQDGGEVLA